MSGKTLSNNPTKAAPPCSTDFAAPVYTTITIPCYCRGRDRKNLAGVVYFSVTSQDITRLDKFEGEYYFRRRVYPTLQLDGQTKAIEADLYLLKPKYAHLASTRPWDPEIFEARELRHFLRTCLQ
ncbi:MAG: gamma-glutamylcyclotransferase [Cellvibrionaceae bacterium]|nr:gamma-glutamylcyclotransferase [Cellvibrionaceae bacterium]